MLKTLKIENFRGIKTLKTDALRQVNVFFGRNNYGKTSLLEAFFWLFGMSNPQTPALLNITRDILEYKKENFQTLFYALDDAKKIEISASGPNGESRSLKVESLFIPAREVENTETLLGAMQKHVILGSYELKIAFARDGVAYEPVFCSVVVGGKEKSALAMLPSASDYQETQSTAYLPPSRGNVSADDAVKSLFRTKREKLLAETLSKIDPRVRDLVLAGDEILVDFGDEMRLPLSVAGDGMRKVFHLVSAILYKTGGAVIVDEIDNGLHYSAMKPMWTAVLTAAKSADVQLFITTHNIDSLKALTSVLKENEAFREDVLTANFVRYPETGLCKVLPYDYAMLESCIDGEVEIR